MTIEMKGLRMAQIGPRMGLLVAGLRIPPDEPVQGLAVAPQLREVDRYESPRGLDPPHPGSGGGGGTLRTVAESSAPPAATANRVAACLDH